MTSEQVEKLMWRELKKRDITLYDMIGSSDRPVDPDPENKMEPGCMRSRKNRFKTDMGSERMKELLCEGEYNSYDELPPLKISFQDLFKFWWDNCIEQHLFVEEVLEDIYNYLTDKMRPSLEQPEQMDLDMDFD